MFPKVAFHMYVIMKPLFTYGCHPMASNYMKSPVTTMSVTYTLLILTLKIHGFKGIVL